MALVPARQRSRSRSRSRSLSRDSTLWSGSLVGCPRAREVHLSHVLRTFKGVMFCVNCGGWTKHGMPQKLLVVCPGECKTQYARACLSRLS
eukprot:7873543-Pyramimonas_sp.AAC.1